MKDCYIKAIDEANKLIENNFLDNVLPVDVLMIAENCGLSIVEADLNDIDDQEIAGFINATKRIIYVNRDDSENRKVFTIAHELGHWILHKKELENDPRKYAILYRKPIGATNNDPIEKQANCFAGNLLVPKKMLLKYKEYDNKTLSLLFGVSVDVIGFRRKLNGI